jgi:DNA-binding transcriptional LysR family regulator
METKLLEDLITLAETRSFSRAAELRHVSQPTLSRHIKSLEHWAGTDLVDRSTHPTRLTPAGQVLRWKAIDALHSLQSARTNLQLIETDNHA